MSISLDGLSTVPFGREMHDREFQLARGVVHANHGGYSQVPRRVNKVLENIRKEAEELPDMFFRDNAFGRWKESRDYVAEFVKSKPENLVFIENVSTGVNTVLKSALLKNGDAVLVSNLTHEAVINALSKVAERIQDFEIHYVQITFPIESEDEIIDLYDRCLTEHPNIKLVLTDHITGHTAVLMPIKRIAEVTRKHNVLLMVDGAHAVGHIPLDLENLGVDFYTGNLHKWCFCPRSCALFWVHPNHQSWLSPLVTSISHGEGFTREFYMQGTRDLGGHMCSKAAIQFIQEIGGQEKIMSYGSKLLDEAVPKLEEFWGTERLQVPKSMKVPCMCLIRLPDFGIAATEEAAAEQWRENVVHRNLSLRMSITQGHLYARLCCSVFNTREDYEIIGQVFKDLSDKWNS